MLRNSIAVMLLLAPMPLLAQTELTPEEARMTEAVAANQGESNALLEEIVNINSGPLDAAGQRRE